MALHSKGFIAKTSKFMTSIQFLVKPEAEQVPQVFQPKITVQDKVDTFTVHGGPQSRKVSK